MPEIRTDVCNTCHPFYTGEQRIVDTAGQVDRFIKRLERRHDPAHAAAQRSLDDDDIANDAESIDWTEPRPERTPEVAEPSPRFGERPAKAAAPSKPVSGKRRAGC